ncbi:MAG: metallophosphoesterase [Candidatus Riflebacteria bacterium]|nr:metallophosphoesterase [Candidatus Riflebacteria bacterium]
MNLLKGYFRYFACAFAVTTLYFTPFTLAAKENPKKTSLVTPAGNSDTTARRQTAKVGWGPVLGLVDVNSAAIRWSTTATTSCSLLLNGTPTGHVISDGLWHQISLEGLTPETKYSYQIEFEAGRQRTRSTSYEFTTAPKNLSNWSFIVFGDTRTNHADHRSVIDAIGRVTPKPWLALHTGDMGENGGQTECWNNFFQIENNLLTGTPFLACMGNHEKGSPIFYRMFQNPLSVREQPLGYYSFHFANALFIVLNSESDPRPQTAFLEQTLRRASEENIPWKFIIWHQTPFSSGSHGGNINLANQWVPLMEKYDVTCGFYGHDHLYEHSIKNGFHHVTAGGGGAPLYAVSRKPNPYSKKAISKLHYMLVNVSPESVNFTAYGVDGKRIDSFDISLDSALSGSNSKTGQ